MERFEKVLNPLVILLGVIIILIVKLEQSKQEIMKLEYLLSVLNGFTAMTYQKRMRCVEF